MQEIKTQQQVEFAYSVEEASEQDIINYGRSHLGALGYSENEEDQLDLDHYRTVAISIQINKGAYKWAIGDMIVNMRRRFGRLSESIMEEFANLLGEEISTLYNSATTSENWWNQDRRYVAKHISHSHHSELNGLEEAVQDELIAQAFNERWTVRRLRDEAKKHRKNAGTDFNGVVDQTEPEQGEPILAPENNLSGLGGNAAQDEEKPRPDNEYEQLADQLEGDDKGYDWTDDRKGLVMIADDPIVAADQLVVLVKSGKINSGWVASLIQRLMQELEV